MNNMQLAQQKLAAAAVGTRPRFVDTARGRWTIRIVVLILVFGGWELGARDLPRALMAPPSEIFQAFINQAFVAGTIWGPFFDSLLVLFSAFFTCLVVGIPIGLAMGRWKPVGFALDPYVTFLYALPHVSLVPVMIIFLGFDFPFRFAYVILSAIWPFIINTMAGVRAIDEDLIDAAKAYCANERQIMFRVIIPAVSPFMVAAGRQAFSVAWVGVIVSEITSTLVGIGGQIELFAIVYLTADMFVPIFFIMAVAVATQGLTAWAQKKLTPWQTKRSN